MSDLALVILDVDGTLVDSQGDIWASMQAAYAGLGLPVPSRAAVLSIVGLSLPAVFARLSPDQSEATQGALSDGYKSAYAALRQQNGASGSPLFPGAREAMQKLTSDPNMLLAVATGKSRRGLDGLIAAHDLHGVFISTQVADNHPSKPHPSMIEACLLDAGVEPARAVMVGDTSYDMDMARAAGVGAIAVGWGYHQAQDLNADRVIDDFADLHGAVTDLLEPVT